jgi:hypothetical protein
MGQLFDWEGLLGHERPAGMMSILGSHACHCHYEAGGGARASSGPLPGGRAQGALCVEKPFLTSAILELRVPQVRRLPQCISRVRITLKCLALCKGLGHPRSLIFARAICATHALSPSARSTGFCVIWVCISFELSAIQLADHYGEGVPAFGLRPAVRRSPFFASPFFVGSFVCPFVRPLSAKVRSPRHPHRVTWMDQRAALQTNLLPRNQRTPKP